VVAFVLRDVKKYARQKKEKNTTTKKEIFLETTRKQNQSID